MASLTFPNHSLPTLLHTQSPKFRSSQNLLILSRSSNTEFCGLNFSHSSSFSIPFATSSSVKVKGSIFAKVTKGSKPPPFTLKDQDGKNVCAFRHSYEKFKKAGAEMIGIIGDDPSSHKTSIYEGNKVRKEWGVQGDFFGALAGRETYVLDKNGVVQLVYNNQFQPEKHIDETLKILQTL